MACIHKIKWLDVIQARAFTAVTVIGTVSKVKKPFLSTGKTYRILFAMWTIFFHCSKSWFVNGEPTQDLRQGKVKDVFAILMHMWNISVFKKTVFESWYKIF